VIETEDLEFRGWRVRIERKSGRKNMTLILKPGRPLLVRAPRRAGLRMILEFIESRVDWIAKHQADFEKLLAETPGRALAPGQKLPLFGEWFELTPVLTPLKEVFLSTAPGRLQVHLPLERAKSPPTDWEWLRPLLREFYRRKAVEVIAPRFHKWVVSTGLQPTHFRLREARQRWGSCNSKGRISLNWRMIVYDLEIIDSIIVHELCHLKHLNHSDAFWSEVAERFPAYAVAEKRLKKQAAYADFLEMNPDKAWLRAPEDDID
jgi:predicted metal-dependent hydrolase